MLPVVGITIMFPVRIFKPSQPIPTSIGIIQGERKTGLEIFGNTNELEKYTLQSRKIDQKSLA